jgi:hypothetical protein
VANTANSATTANTAANANALGGSLPAAFQSRVPWALTKAWKPDRGARGASPRAAAQRDTTSRRPGQAHGHRQPSVALVW